MSKFKRGKIKEYRELLNAQDDMTNLHRHNQYHQLKRKYGDYLYNQDREKFMFDLQNWIEAGEPK